MLSEEQTQLLRIETDSNGGWIQPQTEVTYNYFNCIYIIRINCKTNKFSLHQMWLLHPLHGSQSAEVTLRFPIADVTLMHCSVILIALCTQHFQGSYSCIKGKIQAFCHWQTLAWHYSLHASSPKTIKGCEQLWG